MSKLPRYNLLMCRAPLDQQRHVEAFFLYYWHVYISIPQRRYAIVGYGIIYIYRTLDFFLFEGVWVTDATVL